MKSDFQISNECEKKHIAEVAGKLGIKEEDLIFKIITMFFTLYTFYLLYLKIYN